MNAQAREAFIRQYAVIRHSEGRGSENAEYYRALPYSDISGRNSDQWRIRARTFDHFVREVIAPLETSAGRTLDLLDLGAGNGWMSCRLQQRGHHVIPVDIFVDDRDGLGAIRKYSRLDAVAADFDELPFRGQSFDAIVFNASIHYSSDYFRTLTESVRCLRPGGRIIILDSPLYARPEHGERMRRERQSLFERTYGFRSEALGSIEYLDRDALARLSRDLRILWEFSVPWYGWKWAMRPLAARLRARRPPSKFLVIAGRVAG